MGSSCSRDAPAAVDTDATAPPIPSMTRSTEASILQHSVSADPTESADGGPARSFLSRLRRSNHSGLSRQQERELREIEQLQFELAAMEALFQSMLGQAFREMAAGETAPEGSGGGAPPASREAVRQLPSVRVSPEDLIEESNRECIICYVENHINDTVVRLPCGHLFHRNCITQWLLKRCTCPVCRYELPTDDALYERGRVERMRMRRPRMRRHELERMPARELRELAFTRLNLSDHFEVLTDRADLIDRIVKSGKVDIIASPDPCEYKISDLRSMSVTSLKHTMNNAGVIFDPLEIVEKDDMVNMFLDSGRVVLLPEGNGMTDDVKIPEACGEAGNELNCSGESSGSACICSELSDNSPVSSHKCTSPGCTSLGGDCAKSESGSEKTSSDMKPSQTVDIAFVAGADSGLGREDSASGEGNAMEENNMTFSGANEVGKNEGATCSNER